MSDDLTSSELAGFAARIVERIRSQGCTCTPVITLTETDGSWFADVHHETGCDCTAPAIEYVAEL